MGGPAAGNNQDLNPYQLVDTNQDMNTVAIVTGAPRTLGLALVQGLAQRLDAGSVVYLTGRDPQRVQAARAEVPAGRAEVRGPARRAPGWT
jgi:NAD(P)-dependent dehydrogenase (short-subunit alcohol dehydrogenase family)